MATRTSRPVRTLLIFCAIIALAYISVAALGNWKPKLGLDLAGGTEITLQAQAVGGTVTSAKLDQAVDIIDSRVNGAGVSEAQVSTQGSNIINVDIPGKVDPNLAKTIGETAQLRFRLVAQEIGPGLNITSPGPQLGQVGKAASVKMSVKQGVGPFTWSATGLPAGLSISSLSGAITGKPTFPGTYHVTFTVSNQSQQTGTTVLAWKVKNKAGVVPKTHSYSASAPSSLQSPDLVNIPDPYSWVASPPSDWTQKLQAYTCPTAGKAASQKQLDVPSQPLLACDQGSPGHPPNRYLLGPAVVEGTQVTDASAGIPQNQLNYAVTLSFDGSGTKAFADATSRTAQDNTSSPNTGEQIAIVLDGQVLSAPTNEQAIPGGQAIITGGTGNEFTQSSSSDLANALKYGALPLTFVTQDVETEGPELAGGQLDAGILAGIIGLILVGGYCVLYYRGLAIVVLSSLGIAGLITYACVLLLGHAYGFTLSLPGVAGLIVAVGITADSFIVYFERLRDEVRDGKTLRTSVETGWRRARMTIVAADSVSILAALVLYIFTISDVKGFAFTLGLTTIVDLFVVFFFTKPVVTLLARTRFFGHGHKLSGLDRQHLGLPPLRPKTRPAAQGPTVQGES